MAVRKINNNFNVISDNLKKYRKENNLSQCDLTKKLELLGIYIHKNDICLIEANKRTVKDYELWGFSQVLQKDIKDFFSGIDKKIEY